MRTGPVWIGPVQNGRGPGRSRSNQTGVEQTSNVQTGLDLTGPRQAFLIQGDDRIGALHQHHLVLGNAGVNVLAANGVVDGMGRFGYILWVRSKDYEKAADALQVT